ncbi:hypothetical protein CBR_g10852 [Chara braunii]|uniref:PPM-type phosphatase domain-containing protein n=1 Tax=Chara braunii TaxID=69332 RepID=A0A388KPE2_CHABU|nr:hypothetical protein CBR_g10852 [Chara braunii]|eukprot:GBG71916.1 hypothetical protein CBR_g10852 [Chara braunii]
MNSVFHFVTCKAKRHKMKDRARVNRIVTSGGQVARMRVPGGYEIGPLRSWPGGLCISRSLGDSDAGKCILPVPHVKQIKLSTRGGRLILATDGIWDVLSNEKAAKCCRGLPPQKAASLILKEAVKARGVKDDMTVIVVDILPPEVATCDLTCTPRGGGGGGRARGTPGCNPAGAFEKSHLCGSWGLLRAVFCARSGGESRGGRRGGEGEKAGEGGAKKREKRSSAARVAGMEELYNDDSILMSRRIGIDVSMHTGVVLRCEKCKGPVAPPLPAPVPGRQVVSADADFWKGPFQCRKCKVSRHGGSVG